MHISLEPELSLQLYEGVDSPADVRAAAVAMFESAQYLSLFTDIPEPTQDQKVVAREVFKEEEPASAVQSSAVAVHLRTLMDEYDQQVVLNAAQMRTYITNRLIEESQAGKRHAIRALEMLGKISGVDLFTERSEVLIKTQPTEELQAIARNMLAKIAANSRGDVEDAQFRSVEDAPEVKDDPFEASREALNALAKRD